MIEKELNDGILTLRLAHGRASALDVELLQAMADALDDTGDARAVVLTGTGGIFSGGVDLKRVLSGREAYAKEFIPMLDSVLEKLFAFPKPVVSAINGHAIAGGCIVALAGDHRMMASGKGRIGIPEMKVGVPFPVSALELLAFVLPKAQLQSVTYNASTYLPEQALALGMVDEVVDADELLEMATKKARQLAAIPAETFAITKQMLRREALERMQAQRKDYGQRILECWSYEATYRRIEGFVKATMG